MLLISCNTTTINKNQQELDKHKNLWSTSKITNYQYSYKRFCFCPQKEDIVVVVKEGVIYNAYYTPSDIYLDSEELKNLTSIDEYFDFIQDIINKKVFSLSVDYNSTFGYPMTISIDYYENAVDDKVTYKIFSLQSEI